MIGRDLDTVRCNACGSWFSHGFSRTHTGYLISCHAVDWKQVSDCFSDPKSPMFTYYCGVVKQTGNWSYRGGDGVVYTNSQTYDLKVHDSNGFCWSVSVPNSIYSPGVIPVALFAVYKILHGLYSCMSFLSNQVCRSGVNNRVITSRINTSLSDSDCVPDGVTLPDFWYVRNFHDSHITSLRIHSGSNGDFSKFCFDIFRNRRNDFSDSDEYTYVLVPDSIFIPILNHVRMLVGYKWRLDSSDLTGYINCNVPLDDSGNPSKLLNGLIYLREFLNLCRLLIPEHMFVTDVSKQPERQFVRLEV